MKRYFKENGFPILLLTTVLSGCAYIYSCGIGGIIIGFIVFSLIYSILLFGLFDFLKQKNNKLLTVAVSVAFIMVQYIAAVYAVDSSYGALFKWFLEPSDFRQVFIGNITALLLVMGSVLGSGMYYFTRIRYRAIYVFLIIMCPFALFAKTFTSIPVIYTIILVTVFFVILITNNSGISFNKGSGFYVTVGVFIAAVTIVSSFFPKMQYAPYREEFDELITGISIGAAGRADFSTFSDSSATSGSDDETVLFRLYGDNPHRIRRQCFNIYNADDGVWSYYGDANNGNNGWRRFLYFEDISALVEAVGYNGSEIKTENGKFRITALDTPFHAVYVCDDFTNITPEGKSLTVRDIYRTELDEYFTGEKGKLQSYEISYTESEYSPMFSEYFTDELAEKYKDSEIVASYIRAKDDAERYNNYLLSLNVRKNCYKNEDSYEIIKALTDEITKGKSSDYEKAKAIEKYFLTSEFIYDDKFTPTDSSVENFILNTHRGSCIKYATAMTLMCREAGLTARYVEGFLVNKYNSELNCYEINGTNGHSYVEVWIDGYGWTDFDPTSNNVDDGYVDKTFVIVGIIAVISAFIIVLVFILRPILKEISAKRRIRKSRGRTQLILIYKKIVSDMEAFADRELSALTPEEIELMVETGLRYDISDFISDYRSAVYGDDEKGEKDYRIVYENFRRAVKSAIKERKRDK